MPPVEEAALYEVLKRLRDVRAWAVYNRSDPWAFRQAMIIVTAIDTAVALEAGIQAHTIDNFDNTARKYAEEFLRSNPRGWKNIGR